MKILVLALVAIAIAGCTGSTQPPEEKHDQLRRHIEEPLNKAKAVEALQQQSEEQRRQQLDTIEQ